MEQSSIMAHLGDTILVHHTDVCGIEAMGRCASQ